MIEVNEKAEVPELVRQSPALAFKQAEHFVSTDFFSQFLFPRGHVSMLDQRFAAANTDSQHSRFMPIQSGEWTRSLRPVWALHKSGPCYEESLSGWGFIDSNRMTAIGTWHLPYQGRCSSPFGCCLETDGNGRRKTQDGTSISATGSDHRTSTKIPWWVLA